MAASPGREGSLWSMGSVSRPDVGLGHQQVGQKVSKERYVKAQSAYGKIIMIPLEVKGLLSMVSLQSHMPNVSGLKFKDDRDTEFKYVKFSEGHFYPPDGTWRETTYLEVLPQDMYIKVKDDDGKIILLPLEGNGKLLLKTLKSQIPNATGLKFKDYTDTVFTLVGLDGEHFSPPGTTWGNSTYWAIIQRAVFIEVKDNHGKIIDLPSEDNGTLLLDTLKSVIPNAMGLKFKTETDTTFKLVEFSKGHFFPPDGTWGDTTYWAVFP